MKMAAALRVLELAPKPQALFIEALLQCAYLCHPGRISHHVAASKRPELCPCPSICFADLVGLPNGGVLQPPVAGLALRHTHLVCWLCIWDETRKTLT
ncbi:uncharacterized protein LY79DRAFT_339370 [Colletotrichum navitas]|uniref:Uncharacterized protein n=1 Tax=Colletotrichum navitas TaxID=681940 RepID=A0AAD8PRW9_9PEZI|nr:uncharacterized protein LY79DRAFT_339370 [Colletotrichum navitas]KAK1579601.1 hypothetical protein LY79DRAFT_339370 [Colletotrichum navitas]